MVKLESKFKLNRIQKMTAKQVFVLLIAAVAISVGINLAVLYSTFDNSVDERISEAIEELQVCILQ